MKETRTGKVYGKERSSRFLSGFWVQHPSTPRPPCPSTWVCSPTGSEAEALQTLWFRVLWSRHDVHTAGEVIGPG